MARLLCLLLIFLFLSSPGFAAPPATGANTPATSTEEVPVNAAAPGAPAPADPAAGTTGPLTILVVDQAKALSAAALSHLKSTVATAAGSTGIRFDVYILRTLNGEIGNVAVEKKAVAQGLAKGRDSVLLLLSTQEKQGWLWTSPKLDDAMGDGVKQAILDYVVEPNLQQGNVIRAAEDGTRALSLALAGAYKAQPQPVMAASDNPLDGLLSNGAVPALVTSAIVAMLIGGVTGGGGGFGGGYGRGGSGPGILSRRV